ncbi:Dipeptidyl aminopeptidase/acylaminoacyl-peptidase-like protein [Enhygromyxa salina]|uniref:Dipeptidyl aminopeptidase/acylaminoacyl-peptidase-like protein n=1 Tax=Enhygromyxa salina TaxID=215803 RepID=A0A0C1ZZ28_9BACT|nr:S9 family peptidase [Enhygromyxa salina]KIG16493.1 Dipeptidyl aminopeptidase/acylaminoacyl-peptidase-like protein [Enhygromyxa salina]
MSTRLAPLLLLALLSACAHKVEPTTVSWVTQAEAAPRTEALTAEDIVLMKEVADVELSPSGKLIAHVLRVPSALAEPGRAVSQIWLVDAAGKLEPRRFSPEGHSSWAPRWSPDGTRLAFLSKRPGDAHTQVYVIAIAGGEAEPLFAATSSVGAFEWSPDGKQVAYTSARERDADAKAREAGRDWVVDEDGGTKTRLFAVDLGTAESRELVTSGQHVIDFCWAPDSSRLAVRASEQASIDHTMMYSSLYTLDAKLGTDGAELKPLTQTAGKLGRMAWSPDGAQLAFLGAANIHDSTAGIVHVVASGGGEARALTAGLEATGSWLDWADAGTVLLLAEQGTKTTINAVAVEGGAVQPLIEDGPICHELSFAPGTARSWSRDGVLACVGDTSSHPREVFSGKLGTRRLTRTTVANPSLLTRKLGVQEVVRWKAEDGLELEGVVIKPVNYEAGQRYPLAVLPHGGPEGVSLDGWTTRATYPAQLFAARGYVVFMPNYRGSAGRGTAFATADHQDLGGKEFTDVLAGIDHLVEQGLVDAARVGMGGWSYGGYFSGLAATVYSDRFKAAMIAAAITNWVSFTGTTEIEHENSLVHWKLWPWDDMALPWERSPLAHIANSKTAALIVHGQADTRVPTGQSLELYRGLKHLGVPTQLVMYPREGHGISENVHALDFATRFLEWFDVHVKGEGTGE